MSYRALRGVCIGVDRHLKAGDTADLDPATGKFLASIGAVEEFQPPPVEIKSESVSTPEKSGKKER